jgi:hypothetical protein
VTNFKQEAMISHIGWSDFHRHHVGSFLKQMRKIRYNTPQSEKKYRLSAGPFRLSGCMNQGFLNPDGQGTVLRRDTEISTEIRIRV